MSRYVWRVLWRGNDEDGRFFGWYIHNQKPKEWATKGGVDKFLRAQRRLFPDAMYIPIRVRRESNGVSSE